ncbi:hypothetical protein AA313_de0206088 [Arthrobotrys entomopaga]|nr:hypothetical protein AA313_de0206088 [Arthrobotrys entomopaga]
MGLAGPSKKRKISHDPNNTTWTRSIGFGHRMLTSQGWSPGTVLGPDPHNPHHTAASQIGIKVTLKDDNLGLGCKGSQEDTCTGLGDLQSLLGRLNGKAVEEVREEEDARRKVWVQGRYGMRFVKGEVLESTWVTNGLKKAKKEEEDTVMDSESTDAEEDNSSEDEKSRSKKDKKRKSSAPDSEQDEASSSSSEKDRKSDKAKRKAEKALRKAEKLAKKERKEAKRLRKDEKRRAKAEKKALRSAIAASLLSSTASTPPALPSAQPEPVVSKAEKKAKSLPNSVTTSGTSTPTTGRQALRSKWIAQKRAAVMDAKALNEILMIKAA